jgi:hypothetical protein
MAFLTASQAIDRVVRFEGRICGVSPTPTMQYLSVNVPMPFLLQKVVSYQFSVVSKNFLPFRWQPATEN